MKIYFFIGTTTELIKLSPIIHELETRRIKFKIITSGQAKVNFDELAFYIQKKSADIPLGEKVDKSSTTLFLFWFIKSIFSILTLRAEFKNSNKSNTCFIVHGDPVSSLVGAFTARLYGLKLVHIESGLRSFNYLEPFPEEICRVIISKLADMHFCPNEWALVNLSGVKADSKINTFQNTQAEAFFAALNENSDYKKDLDMEKKKYFVLIVHRQEHVIFGKDEMKRIVGFILKNIDKNMVCVFITHATTKNFLISSGFDLDSKEYQNVKFVPRLKYTQFVNLLSKAEFLMTDGGTNQEEAYLMGVPCLLLRNVTERVEGLGENAVLSKNKKRIIKDFMRTYKRYKRNRIKIKVRPEKIVVDQLVR